MKFKIISLGCPKNLVESEYITKILEDGGHELAEGCDTAVVNTCAFIAEAVKESIETILEEAHRGKKIIVAGCLVERYGEELKGLLPEVELFVGRNYYTEIDSLIGKKGFFQKKGIFAQSYPRRVLTERPMAYLKIQEGCDNRCSYCTVPDIRGGLCSRGADEIEGELRWLVDEGYREINIIGQDITSYGKKEGTDLAVLLNRILKVDGDYFIRLLYLHPRGITDALVSMIRDEEKIIKYLDMPIQHSEDRILTLMNRGYTKDHLKRLIDMFRSGIPGMMLRTTVIVGFPGETEDEFESLLDFVKEREFDMLGVFMYSREEGTPAAKFKGHVRRHIKKDRFHRLMTAQNEISARRLKALGGKASKVIVEGIEGGQMVGRIMAQAPDIDGIAFIRGDCSVGEIRDCKVVKTLDYDVIVEV